MLRLDSSLSAATALSRFAARSYYRLLSRATISEAVPRDASPYITAITTYFGATHDARAGQCRSHAGAQ